MKEEQLITHDLTGYETLETISKAKHFNRWMYETIRPYIKGNILELGSGVGNISQFIVQDFESVTLSDYNTAYCEYLQKKFATNIRVNAVLTIDLQNAFFKKKYLPLEAKFDTIILLNVIEHLADDLQAVDYCHFLLKQHGNLIVLAPAYQLLYSNFDNDLGHFRRYTSKNLKKIFPQSQFEILLNKYFNFIGAVGWLFLNKLTGRTRIQKRNMAFFDKIVPFAKIIDKLVFKKAGLSTILIASKK